MKKFKVKVTKEFECEIEIDDEALDADSEGGDFLKAFRKGFYNYYTWEEHAEHIASAFMNDITFMEGYGIPYVDGKPQAFHKNDSESAINVSPLSGETYATATEMFETAEDEN